MDIEKFDDLMTSIAIQNNNLDQSIQRVLKEYGYQIGNIFDKAKPTEEIDHESEHENIRAIPNSTYLYDTIIRQIDEGIEVVNLDYDKRLRLTGYTTALSYVVDKYLGDSRIVVIVNDYLQIQHIGKIMPDKALLYTSGSDLSGISGLLRSSDLVLIDNSVKELSEAAKRDLKAVTTGTGTVVTLNDLGV